jgi:hypothetical protein
MHQLKNQPVIQVRANMQPQLQFEPFSKFGKKYFERLFKHFS